MASISATGNINITSTGAQINSMPSGSIVNNSQFNPNTIHNPGNHTHTIQNLNPYNISNTLTGYSTYQPALYIDINHSKKMALSKDGVQVIEIDNGELKINEVDKLELTELLSVFQYIKSDYPNLYADLILKGIIK